VRASSSRSSQLSPFDTGAGLGLATVHGIITVHGGRIDVTSRLGEGTQFAVYLPLAAEDQETRSEQASGASQHRAASWRSSGQERINDTGQHGRPWPRRV
jgi:hypothetical protein